MQSTDRGVSVAKLCSLGFYATCMAVGFPDSRTSGAMDPHEVGIGGEPRQMLQVGIGDDSRFKSAKPFGNRSWGATALRRFPPL
ncbi:hypothetical protein I8748_03455 [Nostoc sp. CENA67]|uniref:Uncharacterized protein n=1 Tax=Amazonocrinis nigriterrae CENA67 TaxID=2794033 RepID=A0A8J7L7P8_9NOST|nr:hypothetical protein [Amazonocrinis nigriterrae]MBH8561241.1 hypothetical protein [Amazonocrinis nigriterrae CENA67]